MNETSKRVVQTVVYSHHKTLKLSLVAHSAIAILQDDLHLFTYLQYLQKEMHKIKNDLQILKQVSKSTQYIEFLQYITQVLLLFNLF